ncbi:MAG: hypothetical protein SNJ70_06945, partial [Armatimonadota bacterium]
YGIGNELMGSLLGAVLIGCALFFHQNKLSVKMQTIIAAFVFGLVFISKGLPHFGANTGGALASLPAFFTYIAILRGWKFNIKLVLGILAFSALTMFAIFIGDYLKGISEQTHMGRVIMMLSSGGIIELLQVMERKISVNIMLISNSVWSRLLIISLLASIALYIRARKLEPNRLESKELKCGGYSAIVGVVGSFVFNDSGVLAAANCIVFLWILLAVINLKILQPQLSLQDLSGFSNLSSQSG